MQSPRLILVTEPGPNSCLAATYQLGSRPPAYAGAGFAGMTYLYAWRGFAGLTQKIEIATFFRLQDTLGIEPLIAAWRKRRGLPSRLAPRELCGVDVEIDAPLAHREAYPITGAHERERTSHGGFGRDVQHDRPISRAAHARVGDAHHILDAGAS